MSPKANDQKLEASSMGNSDKSSVSDPDLFFTDPDPWFFFNPDPVPDPGKEKHLERQFKKIWGFLPVPKVLIYLYI